MGVKNFFLAFVLFAEAVVAGAQVLTVESMELAGMDISASTKRRTDTKGSLCALVKVQMPVEGATFEGNVIPPVEFVKGEYWVYMPKGSERLTVRHPDYSPLTVDFKTYGIRQLQSLSTYILTVKVPVVNEAADDGVRFFSLYVRQEGPKVYVDGKEYELSESEVVVPLGKGKHTYRVELPGYETENGTVDIGNDDIRRVISLKKEMVNVTFACATPGAKIYVNYNEKGTAPCKTQAEVGNCRVEARLDGYRAQKMEVQLTKQSNNKTFTLPALVPIEGSLRVDYTPAGAEVYVDGKLTGKSPGLFQHQLIGHHTVEIKSKGYLPEKNEVVINEGQVSSLKGALLKEGASNMSVSQMVKLGEDYEKGTNGKSVDFAEAAKLYRKAAELGNAKAQCLLGTMYEFGHGVKKDPEEAVRWYRMSAEQGYADGQFHMGESYEIGYGRGLTPNNSQAAYWYDKAAKQGHEGAKGRLERVNRRRVR